jgi:hypothetical protein
MHLEKWATKIAMVTKKTHFQWDTKTLLVVHLLPLVLLTLNIGDVVEGAQKRTPANATFIGDLVEGSIAEPESLPQTAAQEMEATSGSMMPMDSLGSSN